MGVHVPLLAIAVAGVALLLLLVSLMAAKRSGALRFTFAALAFGVFAVKAILVLIDGQGITESPIAWNGWSVGADAVTLALLYLAIVKG